MVSEKAVADKTLQVVVTEDEAQAIKQLAGSTGMKVSTYLRNLIFARAAPLVPAWWVPFMDAEPDPARRHRMMLGAAENLAHGQPHFLLEPVVGERDQFTVWNAWRNPVTENVLRVERPDAFMNMGLGRVRLAGDPRLWRIERSIANVRANGQLIWRLGIDEARNP